METLLEKYKNKQPEIVFEWQDSETEAHGWVVINSLRGGAAGGGTRMRLGLDKSEVVSLAKVMEIKFTVAGPNIGGAKSGINFDPNDPRKLDVLKRWYKAVVPLLKNYYGTGGDLNIDEIKDVIPITEEYGLWHPQEGIVVGHFDPTPGQKTKQIGQLRKGVSLEVENKDLKPNSEKKYVVADLITGYGVAESIKHYYTIFKKENLEGKRVIVQGWGNVAAPAGFYLAKYGAKIVGIIDRVGGIINENGFDEAATTKLLLTRKGTALSTENMLSFEETNNTIWDTKADIFIPAAASKIVTKEQTEKLIKAGNSVMSCGANVPFAGDDIFFGNTAQYADENMAVIPDFIANCGMARVFAYLMQTGVEVTDTAIFEDVSNTIKKAIEELYQKNNSGKNLTKNALENALVKIVT